MRRGRIRKNGHFRERISISGSLRSRKSSEMNFFWQKLPGNGCTYDFLHPRKSSGNGWNYDFYNSQKTKRMMLSSSKSKNAMPECFHYLLLCLHLRVCPQFQVAPVRSTWLSPVSVVWWIQNCEVLEDPTNTSLSNCFQPDNPGSVGSCPIDRPYIVEKYLVVLLYETPVVEHNVSII